MPKCTAKFEPGASVGPQPLQPKAAILYLQNKLKALRSAQMIAAGPNSQ